MFDVLLHRILRIPYVLHVRYTRRVKRPRATVLFLHGIGSSGAEWSEVVKLLPDDVMIITIDLLGFGESPKPEWARYSASEQARMIVTTLIRSGIKQRLIIVGHSLGALVAVEVARRYPVIVRSLVLCSPPFYRPDLTRRRPSTERMLQALYKRVEQNQAYFLRLAQFAIKHRLVNEAFSVTEETLPAYIQTLKATIISQSAYDDVKTLRCPITIVYGSLDPFVIDKNLKSIAKANPRVPLAKILVGHEIIGRFVPAVSKVIHKHIAI